MVLRVIGMFLHPGFYGALEVMVIHRTMTENVGSIPARSTDLVFVALVMLIYIRLRFHADRIIWGGSVMAHCNALVQVRFLPVPLDLVLHSIVFCTSGCVSTLTGIWYGSIMGLQ